MRDFLHDIRHAGRALCRAPGFALIAVSCLAVGIGVNAIMFDLVDSLFIRAPAHVENPERVFRLAAQVVTRAHGEIVGSTFTFPEYQAIRSQQTSLIESGAFAERTVTLGPSSGSYAGSVAVVTASYFTALGVRPFHGRLFDPEDDAVGAPPSAVLGFGFWKRQFGGDPSILGRTLRVAGTEAVVIGITPDGFSGLDPNAVDAWVPFSVFGPTILNNPELLTTRSTAWAEIVGRLRLGTQRPGAEAELTAVWRAYHQQPGEYPVVGRVVLGPVLKAWGPIPGRENLIAGLLGGMSLVVLLIACANVSNLLLVRALQREREAAIRMALGASRRRILQESLLEAALLAFAGCLAAVAVATILGPKLEVFFRPAGTELASMHPGRMVAFSAVLAIACALFSGLAPGLLAVTPDVAWVAKQGGWEPRSWRRRGAKVLVIGQMAMSMALLVCAGWFLRSLQHLRGIDLGVTPDHLFVVSLPLLSRNEPAAAVTASYGTLAERLRGIAGVEGVAAGVGAPFFPALMLPISLPPGLAEPGSPTTAIVNAVSAEYFGVAELRLQAGRGLSAGDTRGAERVIVVGHTLASKLWPHESALGRCVRLDEEDLCRTVVGVAEDVPLSTIFDQPSPRLFIPLAQDDFFGKPDGLLVRMRPNAVLSARDVKEALGAGPGRETSVEVSSLGDIVGAQMRPWRLGALMCSVYAGLGVLLSAVGVFCVLAFSVVRQTRAFGIRTALGATPRQILRSVLIDGAARCLVGVAVGGVIAGIGGRFVESLLYQVSVHDLRFYLISAAVVALAGLSASYLPAQRATHVEPMIALRHD